MESDGERSIGQGGPDPVAVALAGHAAPELLPVPARPRRRPRRRARRADAAGRPPGVDRGDVRRRPRRAELAEWLTAPAGGPGVLVLDGMLGVNVRVGDRVAAELSAPAICSSPGRARTRSCSRARSAGGRCCHRASRCSTRASRSGSSRGRRSPRRCCAARAAHAAVSNVQRAIASQPRLEVRLALLLWHLAARWGKVEPGGIRLPIPLTHQLLGRLVGGRAPVGVARAVAGSRAPAWSPATATSGTCTAASRTSSRR